MGEKKEKEAKSTAAKKAADTAGKVAKKIQDTTGRRRLKRQATITITCVAFTSQSEDFATLDLTAEASVIDEKIKPFEKLPTATINPECTPAQKDALKQTRTKLEKKKK